MASTVELNPRYDGQRLPSVEITAVAGQPVLFAGAKILKGTVALLDAGKVKPVTSTPTSGSVLLGVAMDTYDNSGSGVDVQKAMVFLRGEFWYQSKSGDLPGATELMKTVYIDDNATIAKTAGGATSIGAKCTGFTATGARVLIS